MKEQKKYHQRKLAIIEMIEQCDEGILRAVHFLKRIVHDDLPNAKQNAKENMDRYKRIKKYLKIRYNR